MVKSGRPLFCIADLENLERDLKIQPQPPDPQAAPKSWRDVLPIHPAAELFPLMAPDELKALGKDIAKNGLTSPIVLWFDGKGKLLLDGRNRLDAMELIGRKLVSRRDELALDPSYLHGLANDADPYAFVISVNIRRRHLTSEQKRELTAKLLKATPEKSNRQIAETVKTSPTTVGVVRAKLEAKGEVSKLDTRTDARGVKQPAAKPVHTREPTHVCWQCGRRDKVGEVQQRHYACYEDADVWLHDACVSAFDQAEQQREREAAAERIPTSNGEMELQARNEELENEKRRLEMENLTLKSEIEEVKAASKQPKESATPKRNKEYPTNLPGWRRDLQSRITRAAFALNSAERAELFDHLQQIMETTNRDLAQREKGNEAAPPTRADDGLDIPASLRRTPA